MTTLTVFEVEVTGGLSRPQSHGVDNVVPVAGHWGVIGKSQDNLRAKQKNKKWITITLFTVR